MFCQNVVSVGFGELNSLPVHIASYRILPLSLQGDLDVEPAFHETSVVGLETQCVKMLYGVSRF